jgi:hypothetical protein
MAMGLSVKQICYLFYGVAIIFGLLALSFSGIIHAAHFYKFVGIILVIITMFGLFICSIIVSACVVCQSNWAVRYITKWQ